ncbi:carbohydrate ABC transporter permease [Actinacidiphila guanduensis]|jgi:multiple sugar transport system permease protein|uniref:Carbohydrate ABC transporter membrane protein 1, CUT1 family n=1 Tax=Actinacidiphila guanduensis TaxID=310781 RepID=A0A1H0K473_9ACTN|nr:sugar ABC transporter permease [Actinacidiphila guanduensis]SDO50684.1 carbohydrate ABC transporter membrane protein 1, CUT1 family [Actinacidiphila guanduensis]
MTATAPPRSASEAGPDSGKSAGRGRLRPRIPQRLRNIALPYLLLLPALALELLIHIVPMVFGILISFKSLTLFYIRHWSSAPWAGFDNYKIAVKIHQPIGQALLHSFWVTIAFTVLSVGLSWLIGTAAAILMQDTFRGRALLRAIFLVPYALPVYAAVITWTFMFQQNTGLVNHVLHDQLHVTSDKPFWLIGGNSFWALVIVSVWKSWPFAFLALMAGLQNIPRELYEAAAMDGAGVWQQIRKITMPSLRPVNQVLVLVLFLWTFNDFNTPYVMFGQSAPHQADLISIHIYQSSFITWNFGSGSAMSVLLLLFLLLVTAVYLLITSRRRGDADA